MAARRLACLWILAVVSGVASCSGPTDDAGASASPAPAPYGGGSEMQGGGGSTIAPPPPSAGDACGAVGGQCVGVGGCNASVGHLHLDARCAGHPSVACCIMGATSCGGAETFECTDGSATYRPGCRGDHLECPPGTRRSGPPSVGGPPS